ncbi:glucose dehydrogenase [FAD, quinone]-like isoform X2 [Cimex lectularius]|uniref:Glucose-methanol-choline oxidoreductase N-terminal domain-containing protein n=1 Tax=Cimex lectularius TaxID=79782 RepID=A0A8I6S9E7_CIMLE|nr:glucose dehydrogenase [FAD, quinone]-like isoform X2 [Cimex lectularius]
MFYIKYYWILYIYCTFAGIFSLFLFVHKQCENAREWVFNNDFENILEKEYDFIVVGSGTAGSLVAGRLAENVEHDVLLIEAGGEASSLQDIPIISPMQQKSPYDWQYKTVPQKSSCLGMKDRRSLWPGGKVLGGSSRLNYMVYLRGHKTDFDNWTYRNDWSFSEILYYFKKSENQQGLYSNDKKHHGTEGPVFVSELSFSTDLVDGLLGAGRELGYKTVELNQLTSSPGMMQVQVTGHRGARWSSDYAMKKLLKNRFNLRIMTNTFVEKVLLRYGFEAYGVQYKRNNQRGQVLARKAVILSAGTVGSAKILLLSGIGPQAELRDIGIKPIIDLPVGKNLQDHVTSGLDLIILNQTLPLSVEALLNSPLYAYQYFVKGKGVMSHPGCEVVGLFHLENGTGPDLQLMALPSGLSTDAGAVMRDLWEEYFVPLIGKQVVTILPSLLHPKSRGSVQLSSSNPDDQPLIDPQYLSHPDDVKILVKGFRLIEELIETNAMKKMGAHIYEKALPGCENLHFRSDEYWECYVRHLTLTSYHPVGTCKMGNNENSVVDHSLRVHKTNNLFVIDASIMPTLPSANTNAAVMMIAEKGADAIKYHVHTSNHMCHLKEIFLPLEITLLY